VFRAIRLIIPAAALAAVVLGIALPVPHSLPGPALGSQELLWVERAILFFYGFLLLFVPVLRALEGVLPIELSTRGARYADASQEAIEDLTTRMGAVEEFLYSTSEYVETEELD
jgi:hypothetical protein